MDIQFANDLLPPSSLLIDNFEWADLLRGLDIPENSDLNFNLFTPSLTTTAAVNGSIAASVPLPPPGTSLRPEPAPAA